MIASIDSNAVLLKKMQEYENGNSSNNDNNDIQNYLGKAAYEQSSCICKNKSGGNYDNNLDGIKYSLNELHRKNDMLTIFVIFLVIFVLIQYSSVNQRYDNLHFVPVPINSPNLPNPLNSPSNVSTS